MSRNVRIEEVSDSEPEESFSDPEEMDISAIAPATRPKPSQTNPSITNRSNLPDPTSNQLQPHFPGRAPSSQSADRERTKHYQCLYPIYFDSTRSRSDGRRVSKTQAVPNPLAREIVDAIADLGIHPSNIVFEPGKMHPKDWANPGRVRVLIKKDGQAMVPNVVKNKGHLYDLVAEHLKRNPADEETPNRLRIQGIPLPDKSKGEGKVNVPRGWKIGSILPLHSPARSGGGVNENFFKDMMEQMQKEGGMPPGLAGRGGGGGGGGMPDMSQLANMMGGMGGGGMPDMSSLANMMGGMGMGGGGSSAGAQRKIKGKK
ncbi:hypothetical protein MBLNU457_g0201t1 [Dothideomycetes sp. NU457]